MKLLSLLVPLLLLCGGPGCGKEIGDACVTPLDCSPNGDRICQYLDKDGYCTIQGCDFDTCPGEAVCVRFFSGGFANRTCDPATEDASTCKPGDQCMDIACTDSKSPPGSCGYCSSDPARTCNPHATDDCSFDELCSVAGTCVPRSAESRFCMRKCSSNGDCRDGYECRDLEKMVEHGGEPVLEPGNRVNSTSPKFCALAPAS